MHLWLLIIAHFAGDFIFQNDWMQAKTRNSKVCAAHVAAYLIPFLYLAALGIVPFWMLAAIGLQHFLQDRFSLHLRWLRWYGQTSPARWPAGPLWVDQAWHLGFLGFLAVIHLLHTRALPLPLLP